MENKFCPNCGNALGENARFCNACGTDLENPIPANPAQINPVPANSNSAAGTPPVVPGRFLGISSLILAIPGPLYALLVLMMPTTVVSSKNPVDDLIEKATFFFILSAASLVLAIISRRKGYKNPVSLFALILSIAGTLILPFIISMNLMHMAPTRDFGLPS